MTNTSAPSLSSAAVDSLLQFQPVPLSLIRRAMLPNPLQPSSTISQHHAPDDKPTRLANARHRVPEYLQDLDIDVASLSLPSQWNPKDKCQLIELSKQCLKITYNGSGKNDGDAASVRANHSMPAQCGIYYYEVDIISKGRDGYIGIGFCASNVNLNRLPGWEPQSWGYHGDDGHCFACSGTGKPYGPTFTTGDTIGCCVNFVTGEVFYTKNGIHLGSVFRDIFKSYPSIQLYPTIGLRTPGEIVEANFGQRRFKYDIEQYVRDEKSKLWKHINTIPITPNLTISPSTQEELSKAPPSSLATAQSRSSEHGYLNAVVLEYMIYHGYSTTAETFARNLGLGLDFAHGAVGMMDVDRHAAKRGFKGLPPGLEQDVMAQLRHIRERQHIRDCVMKGDIDAAIKSTETKFPELLTSPENEMVLFELRCQKFVELVAKSYRQDSSSSMDLDSPNGSNSRKQANSKKRARDASKANQEEDDIDSLREAMAYGQTIQTLYRDDPREVIQQRLMETFSLLAYPDPSNAPVEVQQLLDVAGREPVANALNKAILVSQKRPSTPSLDRLYRQSVVAVRELAHSVGTGSSAAPVLGAAGAALVNVRHDLDSNGIL